MGTFVSSTTSEDDSSDNSSSSPLLAEHVIALDSARESVGLVYAVCDGKTLTGSGFRVGSCYFATAKHVIKHCLTPAGKLITGAKVSACFDNDENENSSNASYQFVSVHLVLPDINNFEFDIAILEFGDQDLPSLPQPLDMAADVDDESSVHIIGYPSFRYDNQWLVKTLDPSCKLFQPDHYKPWKKYPRLDYEHAKRSDHLLFYDCWVLHGASGAPVLQYREGRCVVVAMHVRGFPGKHYEDRSKLEVRSQEEANRFDKKRAKKYRIFEAGLRLSSVLSAMAEPMRVAVMSSQ